MLYGKYNLNLATKEQELELKASYFESITKAGIPLIKKYFENKIIRRSNASKDRKIKPTQVELKFFKQKYIYDKGIERGWIKQACREFDLDRSTITFIYNAKVRSSTR